MVVATVVAVMTTTVVNTMMAVSTVALAMSSSVCGFLF
jgi:hypothetical protein